MKRTISVLFATAIALTSYCQCIPSSVLSPGALADDASVGTLSWLNPGYAISPDNTTATVLALSAGGTQTTHYIMASDFGFSIPSTASVCGIVAEIEKSSGGFAIGSSIKDNSVRLIIGGALSGDDLKSSASWPGTEAYESYGGSGNLWGLSINPSDINSPGFGVAIAANVVKGLGLPSANVDHIRLTVYYNTNIILPVTWLHFSATAVNNKIKLNWETTTEINNRFFVIERSADSRRWTALDTINSKSAASGYEWFDNHPLAQNYYRLRQEDADGHSSYSETSQIKYTDPALHAIRVTASSLNMLNIECSDKINHVQLFDLQGRPQISNYSEGSELSRQISTSKLVPGIYIIQVTSNRTRYTTKVFVTH